jgi:DNA (cytosine-5)-methyltransferase 1
MNERTLGEICAGISGFGIGFERAGWRTEWQIELDDVNRAVLADRFPHARQFKNLNDWRRFALPKVKCICFGFPCQDISIMGQHRRDKSRIGLAGSRSGLVFEILEIVSFLQPDWLVIENVPALLATNDSRDIQELVGLLAQRNYVGYGRVLDAQYFGIPQKRRRLVLVAGLGKYPSIEFLADAAPVESIPCAPGQSWIAKPADAWAGYTLTAQNKYGRQNSRLDICSELLVAEEEGWDSMAQRGREVELHGFLAGLDAPNSEEAYAAGNSFPPCMAKWIAEILNRS